MELKPPASLILGMVRLGARSGYSIKKAVDSSTRFFWPISLAQVYPQLAKLVDADLLERTEDPEGARRRSSYRLRQAGHDALLEWLRSDREAPMVFRDEGILRLFFADALEPKEQLALVRLLRTRAEESAAHVRENILPVAESVGGHGPRFPLLTARFGIETRESAAAWLAKLERELEAEVGD